MEEQVDEDQIALANAQFNPFDEPMRLRQEVHQGFNKLMKLGGYRDDELIYRMPSNFTDKLRNPDLERWFNELTHKYLEYVRRCHLECIKEPLQFDVRELFEKIKLGGLNEPDVREFADLLREAIQELN